MPYHLVIDGNYFLHRFLHTSLKELTNKDGIVTGAVFGFLKGLKHALHQFTIVDKVSVIFDGGYSKRRKDFDSNYKADRGFKPDGELTEEDLVYKNSFYSQKTYMNYILWKLGCRTLEIKTKEADDVIYWITRNTENSKVVMSDDKDMLQMVSENTQVYRPLAEHTITYDTFEDYFGLPYHKFLMARAVIGDPSDGIKGIPGVGPKTIKEVLKCASTESEIVAYCGSKKAKRYAKIPENFDLIKHNMELLDLSREEFTEDQINIILSVLAAPVSVNVSRVNEFFARMDFNSFLGDNLNDFAKFLAPFHLLR